MDASLVFFLDRSVGSVKVATALRAAGAEVAIHDDLFTPDALDTEWLPYVGERGWVVLSKDDRLRHRKIELVAIRSASVGVFILTSGNLTGDLMAEAFVAALPRMRAITGRETRPFVATVARNGDVRVKLKTTDLSLG